MKKTSYSIQLRMQQLVYVFVAVTLVVFLLAAGTLANYQGRYMDLMHNLTTASEFNQKFKEEIDLKTYYYVIDSRYSEGVPMELIGSAKQLAGELLQSTTNKDSLQAISSVLDLCGNLEKKMDQIQQTESFEERQQQLENNVYVLTSLIQEYMYNYLYSEAVQLNRLQQELTRQLLTEMVLTAVGIFAAIVILARYSMRLSRSISQPVVHLNRRMEEIGNGDLTVRSPMASELVEVDALSEGVERMVQRMSQLIAEATEKQASLRHAELALLQAQINPHFLYNTMDTIIWLIEAKKTEEAVEMVSNLSGFFRHSLSKGADIITLAEEEQHIRSYLQIQQVRYKDILSYSIDIDPEVKQISLPKLTLQPLVENALYHGIKLKRGMGHIAITGRREGTEVVLRVQDDGAGMSQARLEQLRSAMERGERVGFGLSTVHERLRLFYGESYGLQVESVDGCGTTITARIPVESEGNP